MTAERCHSVVQIFSVPTKDLPKNSTLHFTTVYNFMETTDCNSTKVLKKKNKNSTMKNQNIAKYNFTFNFL